MASPTPPGQLDSERTTVARTHVHDLPNELIRAIFLAGHKDEHWRRFLIPISHVCGRWRELALGCPHLWNKIDISNYSSIPFLFFERSDPMPFDLTLDLTPAPAFNDRIVEVLQTPGNPERLRSLVLTASEPDDAEGILPALHGSSLLSLVSIDLVFLCPSERVEYLAFHSASHAPLYPETSSLKAVRLRNVCHRCVPPLKNLTTLNIAGIHITPAEFRSLFIASPHLSTLILECLSMDLEFQSVNHGVVTEAPALKKLAISPRCRRGFDSEFSDIPDKCNPTCPCFFKNLVANNLDYLEISDDTPDTLNHLVPLITNRSTQPSPWVLRINAMAINPGQEDVLESIPRNLTLQMTVPYFRSQDTLDTYLGASRGFQTVAIDFLSFQHDCILPNIRPVLFDRNTLVTIHTKLDNTVSQMLQSEGMFIRTEPLPKPLIPQEDMLDDVDGVYEYSSDDDFDGYEYPYDSDWDAGDSSEYYGSEDG